MIILYEEGWDTATLAFLLKQDSISKELAERYERLYALSRPIDNTAS